MPARLFTFVVCSLLAGLGPFCRIAAAPADGPAAADEHGLPFICTYPLDEIGNVPRGLRLGFDAFGRIAVMYDGVYSVLNDSAWVERMDLASASKVRMTTILVAGGKYYYGGRGSWGTAEPAADGRFQASPLVPPDAPAWTSVTPFNKVLGTPAGIYFYELNGLVYWDFALHRNRFFAMPRLSAAFPVGNRVFASCQDHILRELLPASGATEIAPVVGLEGEVVDFAAQQDTTHTLLALKSGRIVTFDGQTARPWPPQAENLLYGRITAMERLVEGGMAIAVADKGVFLFSAGGVLLWSLTVPEFHDIGSMAAGEPGVIWVAGENAVHRIFYDSPVTSFGQHLGLAAVWPYVARWKDRIVVCSNNTLYEMSARTPGQPPSFRILTGGTTGQADFIASNGDHLLVGNPDGVFAVEPDGATTPVIRLRNVGGLRFIKPDTCLVVGSREIAALREVDGKWVECAPRINGVGDAPIRIEKSRPGALWIEMGGDRVARLTLRQGTLGLKRIALPWHGEQWTNVGMIGKIVILSGASGQRAYYDESLEALCEAPRLDRLLNRSPYWLLRIKEDAAGVLWATHAQGIVTFTPQRDDYVIDSATFDLRNDSYPTVTILPDDNIWIATGRSLYHVEPHVSRPHRSPHAVLVSLTADRDNLELLNRGSPPAVAPNFAFDNNSLSFRFFSGTYAWRSAPLYEYRLGASEPWAPVDAGLMLHFPKLRDGSYLLEVRRAGPQDTNSPPLSFPFAIMPPWYRTPASYVTCALALVLALVAIARWINHRSLERNAVLERLVHERTKKLEVTMARLGEETSNAATVAERSRLAGEIHDSVQQGLSGTILHLETTMTNPSISPEVFSQLNIMKSMLSYSREEVQQAVWNLESPLLQNSTLGEALHKLAGYISSGSIETKVIVHAEPTSLQPAIQHNLLRIAQEAITNAVKHAEASRIEVELQTLAGSVLLCVTDNGKGFDPEAMARAEGHFGLRGLLSRAKSINARLGINSSPGAGTTVQVNVPIDKIHPHEPPAQIKPT